MSKRRNQAGDRARQPGPPGKTARGAGRGGAGKPAPGQTPPGQTPPGQIQGLGLGAPEAAPNVRYLDHEGVARYVRDVFRAHDLPAPDARTCARALVAADLRGTWSHGVARLPMYCTRLVKGVTRARPKIRIERVAAAAALVDGDHGLGLVIAPRAMAEAIRIARDAGVGVVGVKHSGHFGMAGLYAQQAMDAACLGFVFSNASPALPPWGGRRPFFGTNPLAFGAPSGAEAPFLADMAMSVVARGKLKFAAQRGDAIPEGLALDKEGRPTTDGQAAYEGAVLPFGGVKGAALSWMMDVLGGVFTGAAFAGGVANPFSRLDRRQDVGHLFVVLRADLFMPLADFENRMDALAAGVKAEPRAHGVEEILVPGEPGARIAARNRDRGIPLTPDVCAALEETGAAVGIAWPFDEAPRRDGLVRDPARGGRDPGARVQKKFR